ncbi:DNA damage-inducible protein [Formosimonas limnophila]|uniref:DNA damage-inducible protein n=1 Tax=Formosimonas limnophila TaxID=1384487 RepID=A0A8J3CFE6_9BURK|nr:type ISP restriction/modification enzyme [Formosimonas limnophila]GHA63881.1 DNA damage-inducible protein [Formosimonas limnophila]
MSALQTILSQFKATAQSEREKGTYFEELVVLYLKNEPSYQDLYSDVWTYAQWADSQGIDKRDTGIDLVAKTQGTDEYHAIQCKFYADDYRIQKSDIDSFFTASGKKPFSHRIIVTTTNNWSEHAEDALANQQPPVSKIDLHDLENSQIDWSQYQAKSSPKFKDKKKLRDHQKGALSAVAHGLKTAERGKLIMACGTGKTFTSLKIAEKLAGKGKRVLFLVPSLSLLSQTLTEWTQESETPLHSFAVCSDSDVGKKRKADDDTVQTFAHELRYPATTDASRLAIEMTKRHDDEHMSVVFSTYHSIDTISKAQKEHNLAAFDLIICDEAHRTTGATFGDDDESNFVKVHDADFIKADKRLYMTATPRIYGEMAKATADKDNIALCSMDDENLYGKELHVITFSEAVRQGLLVDYKVLVLAMDEKHVSSRLQDLLADENNSLKVDDAAKIVGCWKALSKQGLHEELIGDKDPMRRAVAFCQVIDIKANARQHKVSSKNIANMFSEVVEAYKASEIENSFETESLPPSLTLKCEAEHVDGGMNATAKEDKLNWLKEQTPQDTCRILSNVRCLSEGVDVPALDAVLFLTPRNSQVDVVQSVGRVMRNAEGKKRGYVILPVVIPSTMTPSEALNDNKTYKVVWQVLQALRSHDDRFDAMINKTDLMGVDKRKMEVIAVTDKINAKTKTQKDANGKTIKNKNTGRGGSSIGTADTPVPAQGELAFEVGEIERAIIAKIVDKCGNRHHWEDWANDIAKIANTHITRIQTILENPNNTEAISAFNAFAHEIRDDLNGAITDAEIVEMLAQHLITKPVFDALFEGYSFAQNNPMSLAMQDVLNVLEKHHLEKETDTLERFYTSVKERAAGITNATGKQKIVVELYDKFFRNAFPRMTQRLGIVYTPVEVVDFIIHSVNDILKSEFNQTLGSDNVHIIDPFTGTGTFITRLLQSGLIAPEQLAHKYKHEIHANELVLLAYYIAAINIESVYHDLIKEQNPDTEVQYQPFNGICLTDTFQMNEKEDLVSELLEANSSRRKRQKKLDIRVIIGNPPYSSGQESANDNNANVVYPKLDEEIRNSYAAKSKATNKNALYDSYIRAIRWASDRIKDAGVIGFVSGSGFIEKPAMDGMRKCLTDEFTNMYVLNLRGDIRKNMLSRGKAKEGQNIFESGSMTGIAVTFFVKNPQSMSHGNIYYHNIGDDLKTSEKKEKLIEFASITGITAANGWVNITPDVHGDWINQRDDSFSEHISLGDKKDKSSEVLFENYSSGLKTQRDAWCYNYSKQLLAKNMRLTINFYNEEVDRYINSNCPPNTEDFISFENSKISWTRALKWDLEKQRRFKFAANKIVISLYRPFTKAALYFDRSFNEMVYQMPRIFPDASAENRVILINGKGSRNGVSSLMSDCIVDLNMLEAGAQCFPLKLYEPNVSDTSNAATPQSEMFDDASEVGLSNGAAGQYTIKDGITDAGLAHFADFYAAQMPAGASISKEDVFYYTYGLLHSEDYKTRYADNLTKELPRIPRVKTYRDFEAFMQAGRALAELHVDYESVAPYPVNFVGGALAVQALSDKDFYVTKMKFGKGTGTDEDGKPIKHNKTRIEYNAKITLTDIPLEAYDYIVNGKPAIEWVMERQSVTTHKDSGIVNDANDWAIETMNNARYPLELLQRVITVSIETVKIVKALPKLEI